MPLQDQITALRQRDAVNDPWADAPNAWIKQLAPVKSGKVAEDLYVRLYGGIRVGNNRSGYDITHGEMRIESKLSTRSYSGSNCYLWNQVRPDDPYTHLWLVAVDTNDVRAFLIPRAAIPADRLWKQHGRSAGDENTYVIKTSQSEVFPRWLLEHEVKAD